MIRRPKPPLTAIQIQYLADAARTGEPVNAGEIARRHGSSVYAARSALSALRRLGHVVKVEDPTRAGGVLWQLTDRGRDQLAARSPRLAGPAPQRLLML